MAVPHEKRGGASSVFQTSEMAGATHLAQETIGVLFGDEHRAYGERWRDEKGWGQVTVGHHSQSSEFRLHLVSHRVFQVLLQRVLSETTIGGSLMGKLEEL